MKLKTLILSLFLSLALIACSKPLPTDKSDYAGHWLSVDSRVSLEITPEGRVEYSNAQPGKSTSLSSPIKAFNENGFDAGVGPFTTEFKVNQPPSQNAQGQWFMTVDGYSLAKQN